ncbi:MAG: acetolactate synthase [Oscillospiraceae bacterium]|nr:acetolactate synthase [Oscillospiraceae bacterium]
MAIRQLSVFAENKPGSLIAITEALSRCSVDIRAMSLADTKDFGILRLIVSDPDAAKSALIAEGILVGENPVVAVAVPDEPGALTSLMKLLAENSINVEYMYAFLVPVKGRAFVALRVAEAQKAEDILSAAGFETVSDGTF